MAQARQSELKLSASRSASRWTDISVPVRDGMVHWPTDPPVRVQRTLDMERGDSHTVSNIAMGSHTGTHVDAPAHFIRGGPGVDDMPPDAMVGKARVIEIEDREAIKPEELVRHAIRRGERILFKTRNSSSAWGNDGFVEDYVHMSLPAARLLADARVKVVGVDYLSVGGFKRDGSLVHQTLLGAGIWIIEGLDLSPVTPGSYELICLPLRLRAGDGAPARAIVRRLMR